MFSKLTKISVLCLVFTCMGCSTSMCAEKECSAKIIYKDGYIALDGLFNAGGNQSSLEEFLDISSVNYDGDAVLFISDYGLVHPVMEDLSIWSYVMRGVTGDAYIVSVEYLPDSNFSHEIELRVRPKGSTEWYITNSVDPVEIDSKENTLDLAIEHYDAMRRGQKELFPIYSEETVNGLEELLEDIESGPEKKREGSEKGSDKGINTYNQHTDD